VTTRYDQRANYVPFVDSLPMPKDALARPCPIATIAKARKATSMDIAIRPATEADADACGRICYEGFRAVNESHGFSSIFPSVEAATRRIGAFIGHPSVFGVVAESNDGSRIVGFNFLSERDPIRAVGPIVIDPAIREHGIGRRLMGRAVRAASASFRTLSIRNLSRCMPASDSMRGSFLSP
jgi:GNAT superfamily N-acetyltransferase